MANLDFLESTMWKSLSLLRENCYRATVGDRVFYFQYVAATAQWHISWFNPVNRREEEVGAAHDMKAAVWFAEDWMRKEGYDPTGFDAVEAELKERLKLTPLEPVSYKRKNAPWDF